VAAFSQSFSQLELYDDEGSLMLSLRSFASGGVLYDHVRTLYGPLYYLYQILPRQILHIPLNHDTSRVVSATMWTLSALVLFWIVYRVTRSIALALLAHYLGFRTLEFIGTEALHPQEMCALLLLLVILASSTRRPISIALLGALVTAAVLVKINFGLFLLIACGLVWAFALPRGIPRTALLCLACVAALAVPPVLMAVHIGQTWAFRYALFLSISLVPALMALQRSTIQTVSLRQLGAAVVVGAGAGAAICALFLARGSTLRGMYFSMVVWARSNFAQGRAYPLHLPSAAVGWAAVSVVLAYFVFTGKLGPSVGVGLKTLFALGVTGCIFAKNFPMLLAIGTPMMWIAAAPPATRTGGSDLLRPLLAITGVLTVLYAYPTAGSQVSLACILIVVACMVCLWDAIEWIVPQVPLLSMQRVAVAFAMVACVLSVNRGYHAYQNYRELEPLGLPGATWVRQDSHHVEDLRRLQEEVKSCSMLVSAPGLPSMNLFSGVPLPKALSGFYANSWMLFTSPAEEEAAVHELAAAPRPCAIYSPEIAMEWTNGDPVPSGPVMQYLMANFRKKLVAGTYIFMTPEAVPGHLAAGSLH
jgi:hypothetical protein